MDTLAQALERSAVVISVCPPQAAEDVAVAVASHGFSGVYVDANAINPERMQHIAEVIRAGAAVVDGAILGPPPGGPRTARLYLAGDEQAVGIVEGLFTDGALHPRRASGGIGSASAL
ncbi:hypothetical protein [Streptomyces sp. NPDC059278]|uniref:hypothetical protein n=1 Tax=Streptomyces sp. NPDC059278 TaxID=3346801 RepID=UPI0036CABB22